MSNPGKKDYSCDYGSLTIVGDQKKKKKSLSNIFFASSGKSLKISKRKTSQTIKKHFFTWANQTRIGFGKREFRAYSN